MQIPKAALAAGLMTGGLALGAQSAHAASPVKVKHHTLTVRGTAAADRIAGVLARGGISVSSVGGLSLGPMLAGRCSHRACVTTPERRKCNRTRRVNGAPALHLVIRDIVA